MPSQHLNSNGPVTALITGAGRGIGKRFAMGFAQAGCTVGLLGRSAAELDLTRLEIDAAGGKASRHRADVRDFDQVAAVVERMISVYGGLDTLVANAAVLGPLGPFIGQKPREWKEVVDTNILGVMNCCRAVLPHFTSARRGKILIIVDQGAASPRPGFAAFSATKAAVVRFAESLAEEVSSQNIQVNCLSPGVAYSSMTDEILEAEDRLSSRETEDAERARLTGGTPADKQIQLALFLTSDRSNHLSGKLIQLGDDIRRLDQEGGRPDMWTLRRHVK